MHPEQSGYPAPGSCTGHHLPAPGALRGGHGHPGALVHGEAGRSDAVPGLRDRPRRVLLLCLGYGKQLTKQLRVSEPEAWQHLGISQLRAAPGHLPGEAVGAAGGSGAWTLPRKRPNLGFFRLGLGENLPGLSFPGWDLRFPWGGVPHPCGQRWGFPTVGTASSCTTQGWFPLCPTASTRTFWGCQGRAGELPAPPACPPRALCVLRAPARQVFPVEIGRVGVIFQEARSPRLGQRARLEAGMSPGRVTHLQQQSHGWIRTRRATANPRWKRDPWRRAGDHEGL